MARTIVRILIMVTGIAACLTAVPAGAAVQQAAPAQVAAAPSAAGNAAAQARGRVLRVQVTDLPGGAKARIRIDGPGRWHRVATRSKTFRGVPKGRYRMTAAPIAAPVGTAYPTPTRRSVRVRPGRPATLTVSYGTTVADDVEVVPASDIVSVTDPDPSSDSQRVVVQGGSALQTGDYLVSGVSSAAPEGLLARVVTTQASAGSVTVDVEPATLDEVLPTGSIDRTVVAQLDSSTAEQRQLRSGAADPPDGCSTAPRTTVERDIRGEIGFKLEGEWDTWRPTRSFLKATVSAEASASLKLIAQAAVQCTTGERQIGKTVHLRPITFSIGPIPVVIVPTLKYFVELEAKASSAVSLELGGSVHTDAWVKSTLGGEVSSGFDPPEPRFTHRLDLSPQVDAEVNGTLSARLTTDLYGLAGPYVKVKVGPSLKATSRGPSAKLDATLGVDVGLILEKCARVWAAELCAKFDVHKDGLIERSWRLATVGDPDQPVIASISAQPLNPAPIGSTTVKVTVRDPNGDPIAGVRVGSSATGGVIGTTNAAGEVVTSQAEASTVTYWANTTASDAFEPGLDVSTVLALNPPPACHNWSYREFSLEVGDSLITTWGDAHLIEYSGVETWGDGASSQLALGWGDGRVRHTYTRVGTFSARIVASGRLANGQDCRDDVVISKAFVTAPTRQVTVYNKVTNGPSEMREDVPAYLSTVPQNYCRRDGCMVPGTDVGTGAVLTAYCVVAGARTTNGQDNSSIDDANPGLFTSTRWYGIRWHTGATGYLSEVWIDPSGRGGLGLPGC